MSTRFHRFALLVTGLLAVLGCNSTSNSSGGAPAVRTPATATESPAPGEAAIALPPLSPADPRERVIAVGVRELLESEHLGARPIDDAVSKKAIERFIERLDPGRLMLLEPQVAELRRHADRLDDELAAGDLEVARLGDALLRQQRAKVAAMVQELLSQPFDLTVAEQLETDPEKRPFPANDGALRDAWRKQLKRQVLERITRFVRASEREAEDAAKKDDDKGKGKGKGKGKESATTKDDDARADAEGAARKEPLPTTDAERETRARKELAARYSGRFSRLATGKPLEAVERFVNSITGVFDPHTAYLAPEDKANFDIQMSGSLEGIGAVLTEDDHYIEIREVVPGGAAWRQGDLEAGDLILAVKQEKGAPVDVVDMRINDVVKLIRGPKGTLVTLSVRKPDDRVLSVEIQRDVVVVEASYARGAMLDLGDGYAPVGYVYLPSFYGNTRTHKGGTPDRNAVDDVRALLKLFTRKKVGGVVLDLRGNGGGLLSQANDITGLFIEEGPVVQAKGAKGAARVLGDEDPKVYFEGELIALVDRFSASASEILAGALQDYGRALVVGTGPTHGKGTVQMLVDLNRALGMLNPGGKSLGVLKLTVQQYFLVDGESTQQRGVQPDVVLPDPASFVESGERYLDNSIPWSSIDALSHKSWPKPSWSAPQLASTSQQRRAEQPVFATIAARGKHLAERRDKTLVPLQLEAWRSWRKQNDDALEALDPKLDEQPTRFSVELMKYRPEKPQPDGGARKDTGDRLDRWAKSLTRDPWITESLHLLHDMTATAK